MRAHRIIVQAELNGHQQIVKVKVKCVRCQFLKVGSPCVLVPGEIQYAFQWEEKTALHVLSPLSALSTPIPQIYEMIFIRYVHPFFCLFVFFLENEITFKCMY